MKIHISARPDRATREQIDMILDRLATVEGLLHAILRGEADLEKLAALTVKLKKHTDTLNTAVDNQNKGENP